MTEAAAKGAITRSIQKRSTADAAAGYLSIVEGLRELLKVPYSSALGTALTETMARLRTTTAG